ncbi:MAG: TonB-dependent receptor, partial [Bacteroidota bacterium]
MKHWQILSLCFAFFPISLWSQESQTTFLEGKVLAEADQTPLVGAQIIWAATNLGTNSGQDGSFRLRRTPDSDQLVVRFFGYEADTILIGEQDFVEIKLQLSTLEEVAIEGRQSSTSISFLDPLKTENIGEKELEKAACCNLSESFETNPSVDVAFTDAITGTRQIQLLGLAGPYTQITRENMPHIRGLSSLYGLTYTPGFWVAGMQLNKGAGSVINGYESVAGQINIELRKPPTADRLGINLYANEMGRLEANLNLAHRFEDSPWSTALLLHTANRSAERDRNQDGFMDLVRNQTYIGLHRWHYIGDNGLRFQAGIKGVYIDRLGGQVGVKEDQSGSLWALRQNTRRLEGFAKIGKVLDRPGHSMGLQLSAANHDQVSEFGRRGYDANQQTAYANFIYQGIIGSTAHTYKTGVSFQYDRFAERLESTNYDRTEVVPGAYFEYTYNFLDKLGIVGGIRADYHNLFGAFVTPRFHLRYALAERTILRASAGRGQRTANILAENNNLLASSREIIIEGTDNNQPYGLNQEVAWNYGVNLTQLFTLDYREGTFSLDFYRTDFVNQIVLDLDRSPRQAVFYNLDGSSYSNSFQAQLDYELIKRLDVRLAYRWYDVKTTYDGSLRQKPLIATHRTFVNLAYETRNYWKFDYTFNWESSKRIPFTSRNPGPLRLGQLSPAFFLMNAQISKTWREKLDVYLGGENLLNFVQENPILASRDPFGRFFDSSLIWGPIYGRNVYIGMRYK